MAQAPVPSSRRLGPAGRGAIPCNPASGRVGAQQAERGGAVRAAGRQPRPLGGQPLGGHPAEIARRATDRRSPRCPARTPRTSHRPGRSDHTARPGLPRRPGRTRTAACGAPARRCAAAGRCRERRCSSGPVMSRPWAQCSASRVVARVAGFIGASTHDSGCPGPAARSARTAARRASRHRSKTTAGSARCALTMSSASWSTVVPESADGTQRGAAGAGDHRFLGLREVQHDVGDAPALGRRWRRPLVAVEAGEDLLQPVLLGLKVVKDGHSWTMPRPPGPGPGRLSPRTESLRPSQRAELGRSYDPAAGALRRC